MTGKIEAAAFANGRIREAVLTGEIIRADGRRESLGTIAFFSRNPLKRLAWRIGRWLRGDFI